MSTLDPGSLLRRFSREKCPNHRANASSRHCRIICAERLQYEALIEDLTSFHVIRWYDYDSSANMNTISLVLPLFQNLLLDSSEHSLMYFDLSGTCNGSSRPERVCLCMYSSLQEQRTSTSGQTYSCPHLLIFLGVYFTGTIVPLQIYHPELFRTHRLFSFSIMVCLCECYLFPNASICVSNPHVYTSISTKRQGQVRFLLMMFGTSVWCVCFSFEARH